MNIEIQTNKKKNHVFADVSDKHAPNIIFIMTPIVSVSHELGQSFLKDLTGKGCNIFGLDFLGIGKSEGTPRDITFPNMADSLLQLIVYIQQHYGSNIHLYGGTGTGGIIGQALASDERIGKLIQSYSQFGAAVHKDTSPVASTNLMKFLYPLVVVAAKLFPGVKVPFTVPEYDGVNAEKENAWYQSVMHEYAGAFDLTMSLMAVVLSLFIRSKSPLVNPVACPVLVLAAEHDRYFNTAYIQRYYDGLHKPKSLLWIQSSHLAFLWEAKQINQKVIDWVFRCSSQNG